VVLIIELFWKKRIDNYNKMKLLTGIIGIFKMFFVNDYDDGYTEYLSEQKGIYVDIKDVYDN